MNRDEALAILSEYIENENLIRHMLAVEAAMRDYADRLDQEADLWGLAGLLHDFDWEIHPSLDDHPQLGAPILRSRGVPEEVINCILSHSDRTGVPRNTPMRKCLYACDELTGLITAVALVRPSRSIHEVDLSSIRKKWGSGRFAAAIDRHEIEAGAADFDVDLWVHAENVLRSMQRIAPHLGLEGS